MDEHLDRSGEVRMEAVEGLVTGEMSRDDFIKKAALLGFSQMAGGALGALLAAAISSDPATAIGTVLSLASLLALILYARSGGHSTR